jgi:hypothetical protein
MGQGDSHAAPSSRAGARVGYTRVSTVAQTLEQQNEALAAAGVTKTFSDTLSGAKDDRPGFSALMDYVRDSDTVVVWKLDRLGRNTLHILETVKALTDAGATLISTTDGIDSSTAAGRMVIGVLASMAEFERELVKERTLHPLRRLTSAECQVPMTSRRVTAQGANAGEAMPISSPAGRSGRGAACPTASSGWCPDPTPRRCAVACRPRRPPRGPPDV